LFGWGRAAYLHKKSWNYTREVELLFLNNPGDGRKWRIAIPAKLQTKVS